MYKPLAKEGQLYCGSGGVVVVTGWTPCEKVATHLQPAQYAAIGQLYSPTRGINFLIRNLLFNPQVRHLILLNGTKEDKNSGGVETLLWFFHYGVIPGKTTSGKDCWIINCDWQSQFGLDFKGVGYIDIEIPKADLDSLRDNLSWQLVRSVTDCVCAVLNQSGLPLEPWGKARQYNLPKTETKVFPANIYGHRIEGKTIAETWVKIIHRIKTTGTLRPTGYGGQWQELIDLMAVITDEPEEFYFPEPNYLPIDRNFLEQYKPQMLEDAPYVEGVKYTYGQRMRSWFGRDQIEEVIAKLIKEIDAASAVISLWDAGGNINRRSDGSSDHQHSGSPCLNHIWVRVVDGELSLTATLRSNDMFAAWPPNAMGLRALQQHIYNKITDKSGHILTLGPLITLSESAHIYDDTFEYAEALIANQYARETVQFKPDPAGSFTISINSVLQKVEVLHISPSPGDEPLQRFAGTNAQTLCKQILKACPHLENSHCLYLGRELEKACLALRTKQAYHQN